MIQLSRIHCKSEVVSIRGMQFAADRDHGGSMQVCNSMSSAWALKRIPWSLRSFREPCSVACFSSVHVSAGTLYSYRSLQMNTSVPQR